MTTPSTEFMVNAQGHHVPLEMIKPIDLMRDQLANEIFDRAAFLSNELKAFKAQSFEEIESFIDLSVEQYGATKRPGGQKGNVTLMSFDGRIKIQRAKADSITFDERLVAAKALIDECLHDWTAEARPEIKALIDRAFDTDKEGNIRTGAVLALRRVDIKDPRWTQAMNAIGEAVQVISSKAYVRVYQRVGDSDRWEAVSLDVAGV